MPLAVPGLVLAFGYLAITREGELFRFLVDSPPFIPTDSPMILLVIAYSVRRLPYIVRSAVAGFQQTSASLEEAAANLGAGPITTMVRITAPLIAANLIAGAILAFAFSTAGGVGFADSGPETAILPDHHRDLHALRLPGQRALYLRRSGRLGDDLPRDRDCRGRLHHGEEDGGDVPRLTARELHASIRKHASASSVPATGSTCQSRAV